MISQANNEWPGMPCDADGWPYSKDIAVFDARRAVGQFARSFAKLARLSTTDPVGLYLMATVEIEDAIKTISTDLVAEARARGLTWKEIGHFLGVGDATGAPMC